MAFQLLTGKLPFGELTNHNELANYQKRGKNGDWSRHLLSGIDNGNQWMQLLEGCLQANLKKRIQSVDEVLRLLPAVSHSSAFNPIPPVDTNHRKETGTCLRVMQGEQYGTVYNLSDIVASGKRIITLGRETGNLIVLKDNVSCYMSRYHCCIEAHSASGWIIRDGQWNGQSRQWMESSNGTFVNSQQVTYTGYILEAGDIISIGDIKIRFENH